MLSPAPHQVAGASAVLMTVAGCSTVLLSCRKAKIHTAAWLPTLRGRGNEEGCLAPSMFQPQCIRDRQEPAAALSSPRLQLSQPKTGLQRLAMQLHRELFFAFHPGWLHCLLASCLGTKQPWVYPLGCWYHCCIAHIAEKNSLSVGFTELEDLLQQGGAAAWEGSTPASRLTLRRSSPRKGHFQRAEAVLKDRDTAPGRSVHT